MNCHSCDGAGCAWCGGSGVEPNKLSRLSEKALDKWGIEHQVNIAIEELSECIDALCKHRRGRNTAKDVAGEIADLIIVTEQMKQITGEELVEVELDRKLNRLARYIKEGGR